MMSSMTSSNGDLVRPIIDLLISKKHLSFGALSLLAVAESTGVTCLIVSVYIYVCVCHAFRMRSDKR